MRIVLDECLPRQLKLELAGHHVRTAQEQGWAGLRNGDLLQAASGCFDVFLTVDRNIGFQQNVTEFGVAVIVMVAEGNRLQDLRPLMKEVRDALPRAKPGQLIRVGSRPHHFRLKESPYSAAVSRSVLMTSWSSGVR
jgi:hypothetical protein